MVFILTVTVTLVYCDYDVMNCLQEFVKHKEGKELCSGKDSFNNHLLHIACKNGNFKVLKVRLITISCVMLIINISTWTLLCLCGTI